MCSQNPGLTWPDPFNNDTPTLIMPFFLTSLQDHEGRERETLIYYNSSPMPHPGSLTPHDALGDPCAAPYPRRSIESFLDKHTELYNQGQVPETRPRALEIAKQEGRWLHCEVLP